MLVAVLIVLVVAAMVVVILVAGAHAVRGAPRPPPIDVTPARHPDDKG